MRKVIGVVVAVLMCVSMCAGFAFASDGTGVLSGLLGDIDLSNLGGGEVENLLGDLANVNLGDALLGGVQDDADAIAADIDEIDLPGTVMNVLSGLLGDEGAKEAEQLLEGEDNIAVDEALAGLSNDNSTDFVSTVSSIFESFGLGEALKGFSMGDFDLGSIVDEVLGCAPGGDSDTPRDEVASNDFLAGIADTLLGGLQSIGIDTSIIEGLLDNEIVNFFANLYCGWNTGEVDEPTEAPTTEAPTTEAPTTKAPTPVKTGDTSSVMVAIGTLSVAAAAAFVCMKKKRA